MPSRLRSGSVSSYRPKEKHPPRIIPAKHFRLERAFNRYLKAQIAVANALQVLTLAMNEQTEQLWDEAIRTAVLKRQDFRLFRQLSLEKQKTHPIVEIRCKGDNQCPAA